MAGHAPAPRACLTCQTSWVGPEPCPTCTSPGVPGVLSDYCPHGARIPFRGWPCPACRASFIEVQRSVVKIPPRQAQPGWSY